MAIPTMDDYTDYILLRKTFDGGHGVLCWTCLVALALADADRAYALLYFVVVIITVVLFVLGATLDGILEVFTEDDLRTHESKLWRAAEFLSGEQPQQENFSKLLLDALSWTVMGPRSRYSNEDIVGDEPTAFAQERGFEMKIIDKFLEWHPYSWFGQLLFLRLRVPHSKREKSRRALVMLRAVGETVMVGILFPFLGLMTAGTLTDLSSWGFLSSLFSVLVLVIELQHYVNETEPYLIEDNASTGECLRGLRVGFTRVLPGS